MIKQDSRNNISTKGVLYFNCVMQRYSKALA